MAMHPIPCLLAPILLLALIAVPGARAQQVQNIVAVVNDDVISMYDLVNRIRIVQVTSGLEDTPESRRRLQPQVLRGLIDEKLQMQEAARVNISLSDAELDQAIARIEEVNRMPPGGLEDYIRSSGLDRRSVLAQIRVSVTWQKVMSRRLRPTLQIGGDEVQEVLAKLRASQGTTEYLLGELFLAVDSPDLEDEVRQTAQSLIHQMRGGASFGAIAQQFSQSASAGSGGDIGWVQKGQLDEAIERAIENLRRGQVTEPIRTVAGFYVYLLRESRTMAAPSAGDVKVTLARIALSPEPGADLAVLKRLAETVRETVSGCADFARVAGELGAPPPEVSADFRLGDLSPALRPLVAALKVGEASVPVDTEAGLLVFMVCQRVEPPSNLPSHDDVSENLSRQRLDLLARRYLRDLRRAAVVDVRV
ncbi:MAG: peptidylprolyl isomerase [Pseudomonadota bacterium]